MSAKPTYEKLEQQIKDLQKEVIKGKQVEEALKESAHRHRTLIDTMNEGLAEVDEEWRLTFINDRFSEMLGLSREQIIGRRFYEFTSEGYIGKAQEEHARRKQGKTGKYELELVRADGEKIFVLCSPNPSYDSSGNYLGGLGIVTDITELKQAEESSRKSEEKYRFLTENMADIVWTLDLDFRTTYVSNSIEKVLGFTPEERKRQSLDEMITLDSVQRVQKRFLEEIQRDETGLRDTEQSVIIEVEYYHKDGSTRWMENSLKAIRNSEGTIVGMLGVSRDINERKQTEKIIHEKEEIYRNLFENAPIGIGIADEKGNILDFNDAILHPGGYGREDISKTGNLRKFYYNLDARDKVLKKAFEQGYLDEEEVQFRRKDGTPYDALLSLRTIQLEGKSCWQAMVQDVTARKKSEEEIQKAYREWEGIFQAIGHPTLVLDGDHRLIHANTATEMATGKSEKDLMGKRCYEIFHNTDEPPEGCPFEKMTMSGHLETIEMEMEALGGSFLVSCTPMLDEKGRIEKVIHIATDITDRKNAEDALRKSELWLQKTLDSLEETVLVVTPDRKILDINDGGEKMFGYSMEEIFETSTEILHVDHAHYMEFGNRISQAFVRGEAAKFEFEAKRKNGEIFPTEHTVTLLKDPTGEPVGIVSVVRDTSERKKADEALRASEERHRMMIKHMSSGVAVYETKDDGDTFVFKDVNPAAERISNIKKKKTIGRELLTLFPKMDKFGLLDALKRVWKTGKNERLDAGYYRDDLRQGWRENRIYKLPSGEVVAIYDDVTEKREAERKLEASEKRLRSVLETVALAAIMLNSKGQLIFCNDFFLELTGWTREEALGKDWFDTFIPVDIREDLKRSFSLKALHSEEFPEHYENEIVTRSGERRLINWNNTVFFNEKGEAIEAASIGEDITDRRKSEERLRQAQKMEAVANLTGGIAHDYNNLMSIIMGNLSLAMEEAEPGSLLSDFLNEANRASRKVGDLTHELMTLSRGGALVKEVASLEELLKGASSVIPSRGGISLRKAIPQNLWRFLCDPIKMGAVFRNLITNAVDAMPGGGILNIRAENRHITDEETDPALPLKPGDYLHISIQDEGKGIPEEHLEKVFNPYFSTKAMGVQKGMGLGLATAYAIVKKHDGRIFIDSKPGLGTTVNIYLPAKSQPVEVDRKNLSETDATSPMKRVLVMDDEEMLRKLVQQMLERMGYAVETVQDGVEAIQTYKKQKNSGEPFDAVILDLTIKGGMGGEQTIRELLKINPHIKAIVSSGYSNDPVMSEFEKHGFRGAMAKPYAIKNLKEALEKLFR